MADRCRIPSEPRRRALHAVAAVAIAVSLSGCMHQKDAAAPSSTARSQDALRGEAESWSRRYAANPGEKTASLGYAAKMLEAGVQVVYTYVADAHDPQRLDIPNAPPTPNSAHAYGPGEAGYVAALRTYDQAFGKFFARLKADGIDETNTLFVVVPDENDHFVGGPPSPANCDGVTTPCTYKNVGEIDLSIDKVLLTQRMNSTPFSVHSDDAPTMYINTNPGPTGSLTRTMEHDVDALTATNPITGNTDKLSKLLADRAEMKLLHMVTFSPQRTPTFTIFGNDNYFFETGNNRVARPRRTPCARLPDLPGTTAISSGTSRAPGSPWWGRA